MSNSETDGTAKEYFVTIGGSGEMPGVKMVANYDADGMVRGGRATSIGMDVKFQTGPRGHSDGSGLDQANGAFVETLLVAARSRLRDYQESGMSSRENGDAIEHIDQAMHALACRRADRARRGVQGSMRQ